jgi:hypothetical protein
MARILQAAGNRRTEFDPEEFWQALIKCVYGFRLRSTYGKASFLRARAIRLSDVRKHASELNRLLKDDEADEDIIGQNWREILPRSMLSPQAFAEILYGLVDKNLKHLRDVEPRKLRKHLEMMEKDFGAGVSAFEWLAGTALPEVFQKFFGDPTFSRTAHGPTGPFISFALTVLTEWNITKSGGKPYSAGSVGAALTTSRAGRARRKSKIT